MAEDNSGFKVADRRLFTAEGDLRDTTTEEASLDQGGSQSAPNPMSFPEADDLEDMPMSFQTLIFSLSTTALLQLGLAPNPDTNQSESDLPAAKQTIDLLEILQTKTKGNLTSEEGQLLEDCLHDLKMGYVQMVQGGKL